VHDDDARDVAPSGARGSFEEQGKAQPFPMCWLTSAMKLFSASEKSG
jgi:hypothetical protein